MNWHLVKGVLIVMAAFTVCYWVLLPKLAGLWLSVSLAATMLLAYVGYVAGFHPDVNLTMSVGVGFFVLSVRLLRKT